MAPSSQQTIELAMPHGMPYKYDPELSDQLRLPRHHLVSRSGFVPMFENGAQRQPLPRRDGPADSHLRSRPVVATICVVTSSPPFAEGGHLVMARELVRALREEGHDTGLRRHAAESLRPAGQRLSRRVVHRRRARARGAQGRSGDQPALSRLRGAASESRAVAQPPDARVLRPVGSVQLAPVVEAAGIKERARRALIHRVDNYLLTQDAAAAS